MLMENFAPNLNQLYTKVHRRNHYLTGFMDDIISLNLYSEDKSNKEILIWVLATMSNRHKIEKIKILQNWNENLD